MNLDQYLELRKALDRNYEELTRLRELLENMKPCAMAQMAGEAQKRKGEK